MTEKTRGGGEGENENPANFLSTKNLFVSTMVSRGDSSTNYVSTNRRA